MAQLVQLQQGLPSIHEAGADVVSVSPDEPAALQALRASKGLTFPMLTDPDLAAVRAFGILNEDKGNVPHPTTVVIDAAGVIRWRRTDVDYRKRPPIDEVVSAVRQAQGG